MPLICVVPHGDFVSMALTASESRWGKGKKRQFLPAWKTDPAFKWLRNDTEDKMFCTVCEKASKKNAFTRGCTEWQPFLLGASGQEVESTRLTVIDIPLSYNNKDIEDTRKGLGCISLSNLKYEHDRDEKGKLTRWKTGVGFFTLKHQQFLCRGM